MALDLPRYVYLAKGKYPRFRRAGTDTALSRPINGAEFWRDYGKQMERFENAPPPVDEGTFNWLFAQFTSSAEFKHLAGTTQLDYARTIKMIRSALGPEPFAVTNRATIKAVRDSFATKPRTAHKVKQLVSRLYSWAGENDLVADGYNPASDIKKLKYRQQQYPVWSEPEIHAVFASAPKHLLTPLMIALYTGQRREDVVRMQWTAFQGTLVTVVQSKTGEPMEIPCHRDLRKHLASVRTKFGGAIARTAAGRPYTANSLSQTLRRHIESLDSIANNRSIHGLRYAAAGRIDAAGGSVAEAKAVLGHRTFEMAMKYMEQRSAGERAIKRQENIS